MRIIFLVKFYQPFDRGGSEWSTRDLAKLLSETGHQITIITPNYGATSNEKIDNINVHRMPFPLKLKDPKAKIAPFWTNNIIWFIYSSAYCLFYCLKNRVDIIHVHSNEYIPAATICGNILGKSTIVTFRDYQSLCTLGFCLWQKDKTCTFREFISQDFQFFYENYVDNKNFLRYATLLLAAIRAMLMQKIIYFLAQKIDFKIAVSKKVSEIFKVNGVGDTKVINNPVLVNSRPAKSSSKEIIYLGKFSKGKGVGILQELIFDLTKSLPDAKFKFIGSGYLYKDFRAQIQKLHLGKKVKLSGQIDHAKALNEVRKAAMVVVPSIWPEPLPRSVIETILSATPVVATNVGGIKEIIKENIYGVLSQPNKKSLKRAIVLGYKNRNKFRRNINKDMLKIKKHFSSDVLNEYIKVYRKTLST